MSAKLTNILARHRPAAFGGCGIDANREAGFIASHYLFFRRKRGMGATKALEAAKALPATYQQGREYYGPSGGAGGAYKAGTAYGCGQDTLRHVADVKSVGLRFVGYADEMNAGIGHTGWHTDEHGDGMNLRGAVWQVPGKKGTTRLLYGYVEWEGRGEMNEGSAIVCVSDVVTVPKCDETGDTDEYRDAARWADGLAESVADDMRDYNAAYNRGREAGEADSDAMAARDDLRPLLADMRQYRPRPSGELWNAALGRVRDLLGRVADARAKRNESWDNVWGSDEPAWKAGFMDSAHGNGFVRAVRLGYAKRDDWRGPADANPCDAA